LTAPLATSRFGCSSRGYLSVNSGDESYFQRAYPPEKRRCVACVPACAQVTMCVYLSSLLVVAVLLGVACGVHICSRADNAHTTSPRSVFRSPLRRRYIPSSWEHIKLINTDKHPDGNWKVPSEGGDFNFQCG
jgi:hypothetical protein